MVCLDKHALVKHIELVIYVLINVTLTYFSAFDRVQFDQPIRSYPWLVELPILMELSK